MNQTTLIRKAIAEMRAICFFYGDKMRVIEPHQLGIIAGNMLHLSGFDTRENRWKQFLVSDIRDIHLTNDMFTKARDGFRPGPSNKYPTIVEEIKPSLQAV